MRVAARVVAPGLSTTVQDLGRPGLRHLGVPLSGAADPVSLALANVCVGNPSEATALECTVNGPTLLFETSASFAVGGADMNARLNGQPLPQFKRVTADCGETLELGIARTGARSYIAIEGGIKGEAFLGSCSTFLPASLGGIEGRALRAGDIIESGVVETTTPREIPEPFLPRVNSTVVLRATPGPETQHLSERGMEQLFSTGWTVGRRADRMGVRLEGPPLDVLKNSPMASSPVFPGTVQCPPDGAPFLLLVDAQTIGGYPRVAQVIGADRYLAGQLRPGNEVWFRSTMHREARDIALRKAALFEGFLPGRVFF